MTTHEMTSEQIEQLAQDMETARTNVSNLRPNTPAYSYWLGRLEQLISVDNTIGFMRRYKAAEKAQKHQVVFGGVSEMIIGKTHQQTDAMTALAEMDYSFFPTGSRYFGGVKEYSDYDYFAQHSDQVTETLYRAGFRVLSDRDEGYFDEQTIFIFRAKYQDTHIDVQLVKSVEVKTQARDLLNQLGVFELVERPKQRRELWNRAYQYVQSRPSDPVESGVCRRCGTLLDEHTNRCCLCDGSDAYEHKENDCYCRCPVCEDRET